ncbi:TadE/TadG family type IV pilus assembly protein [Kitasatospora sp. NPDC058965]|uniref:TadE/TadG family type IV pilus assembly protein n=1 Tax=Kitasatospora sp. NPDC058965 TaxID=3346682 RepID=UPI0036B88A4E
MRSGERGSLAIEAALVTPVILLLFTVTMIAGKVQQTQASIEAAARAGARAGSLDRHPEVKTVHDTATDAVNAWLSTAGVSCGNERIDVTTGTLDVPAPGKPMNTVVVNVNCEVSMSDLSPLRVPGSVKLIGGFRSVVDLYRG